MQDRLTRRTPLLFRYPTEALERSWARAARRRLKGRGRREVAADLTLLACITLEAEAGIAVLVQAVAIVLGADVFHDLPVAMALIPRDAGVGLQEHGGIIHGSRDLENVGLDEAHAFGHLH